MKKLSLTIMVGCLIFALIGFTGCAAFKSKGDAEEGSAMQKELAPVMVMGTPTVKINKKATAVIMGTGFEPGKEIRIVFTSPDGSITDIEAYLKPVPKADKSGTWGTTWKCGRYLSKKIIKAGPLVLTATDDDYNPIAHTTVAILKGKKKKKKKK